MRITLEGNTKLTIEKHLPKIVEKHNILNLLVINYEKTYTPASERGGFYSLNFKIVGDVEDEK